MKSHSKRRLVVSIFNLVVKRHLLKTYSHKTKIIVIQKLNYSLTSVLHTLLGENAQVRYSEVCVISEKDQMMKTKDGGKKYVRYSEGYTIVHVCDTEVKLYYYWFQAFLCISIQRVWGKRVDTGL